MDTTLTVAIPDVVLTSSFVTVPSFTFVNAKDFATIQAAIDYAAAHGIGTVNIPAGTYTPDTTPAFTPVTLPDGITLQGDGRLTTLLSVRGKTAYKDAVMVAVEGNHCAMRDMTLVGYEAALVAGVDPGTSSNSGRGVVVAMSTSTNVNDFRMERVSFASIPSSCLVLGSQSSGSLAIYCSFEDCWFEDSRVNGTTNGTVAIVNATASSFANCRLTYIHNASLYMVQARGVAFRNCYFEDGAFDTNPFVVLGGYNFENRFDTCWFEKYAGGGSAYFIVANNRNHAQVFDSCHFIRNDATDSGLRVLNTNGTTYGGNKFTNRIKFANCTMYSAHTAPVASTAISITPDLDATLDTVLSDNNLFGVAGMISSAAVGESTLANWDASVSGGFTKANHFKTLNAAYA